MMSSEESVLGASPPLQRNVTSSYLHWSGLSDDVVRGICSGRFAASAERKQTTTSVKLAGRDRTEDMLPSIGYWTSRLLGFNSRLTRMTIEK